MWWLVLISYVPMATYHIDQIDRGYEDIEDRLNAIGAHITREE